MDQSNNDVEDLESLNDQESYFNWIDTKFNIDAAKERIERRQCPKLCLDIKECGFCKFDGDWRLSVEPTMFLGEDTDEMNRANREKGYFNKFIAWNGEMAFLEGYVGELETAMNRLGYMDSKINEYCHQDHTEDNLEFVNGYNYLIQTLLAYFQIPKECEIYSEFGKIQNFGDLHVEAKKAVLSVKFIFYKGSPGSLEKQVQVLRKLVELDPSNPVWYEKLGVRLRCIRKDNCSGMQTSEETSALAKAYKLRPEEPKFFVSLSSSIAEKLKACHYNSLDQILYIESTFDLFKTVRDALNFMKKYTKILLEAADFIESKSYVSEMATTMGTVFSVSLPLKFHDLELAKVCLQTAVEVNPTCSKAHHQLGLLYWVKESNYESALEHLEKAVNCKTRYFQAMVDWCLLLMHKAGKHSELLKDIFKEIFSKDFPWTTHESARLHFLKGCFLFIMKGNEKELIQSWITAYKINEKSSHMVAAFTEARRFKWNNQVFNPGKIRNFLKIFKESENKEILGRIVNETKRINLNPK